ncbi:hypothetical protein B566_EDAN004487 [Ephemera danica]|nr:hypothetical protein B566_EDAN004487 [Ephemera danica]
MKLYLHIKQKGLTWCKVKVVKILGAKVYKVFVNDHEINVHVDHLKKNHIIEEQSQHSMCKLPPVSPQKQSPQTQVESPHTPVAQRSPRQRTPPSGGQSPRENTPSTPVARLLRARKPPETYAPH